MYEENSAIFIFLVIATIGQSFFVFLFAVAAVAMLCGYAESNGKGCNIIGVLGMILGVLGSFISATDVIGRQDDRHRNKWEDLASLIRTGLIVKLVTNSTYILSHAFLWMGAR